MLVLTRKHDEKIIIWFDDGRVIDILVLDVSDSGRVRIGVQAPREIIVDREEVWVERWRNPQPNVL